MDEAPVSVSAPNLDRGGLRTAREDEVHHAVARHVSGRDEGRGRAQAPAPGEAVATVGASEESADIPGVLDRDRVRDPVAVQVGEERILGFAEQRPRRPEGPLAARRRSAAGERDHPEHDHSERDPALLERFHKALYEARLPLESGWYPAPRRSQRSFPATRPRFGEVQAGGGHPGGREGCVPRRPRGSLGLRARRERSGRPGSARGKLSPSG